MSIPVFEELLNVQSIMDAELGKSLLKLLNLFLILFADSSSTVIERQRVFSDALRRVAGF